jgi:hypothetical protein
MTARSAFVVGPFALGALLAFSGCGSSDEAEPGQDAGPVDSYVPPEDTGTDPDAGAEGIECGDEVCTEEDEFCCATGDASECMGPEDNCEGFAIGCTSNEDCDGTDECCLTAGGSSCVESGMCEATGVDCATTSGCDMDDVCCGEIDGVTCKDLGDCEGVVRCMGDPECTDSGAGDCCRQGFCASGAVCAGGPPV